VIKAAIIGAESFGFGTAPMVALGCKYLRICHLNNCATGVATQHNLLRSKFFIGLPEMVINYFQFVAREVREILAALGVRSIQDLIGRTEYLRILEGETPRQRKLDLKPILSTAGMADDAPQYCSTPSNAPFDKGELAERMVKDMLPAIENKKGGEWSYDVRNYNRSIGARLSGEIAKRWGNYGMEDSPVTVRLTGNVGQSFGVWNAGGLHMHLEGDANDYVGKGMAGGKIVLRHSRGARFRPPPDHHHGQYVPVRRDGRTPVCRWCWQASALQYATRARSRSSKAPANHCCEYMTGGVVLRARTDRCQFRSRFHGRLRLRARPGARLRRPLQPRAHRYQPHSRGVDAISPAAPGNLLDQHLAETGSAWAEEIVNDLRTYIGKFWVVKPKAASIDSLIEKPAARGLASAPEDSTQHGG